MPAFMIDQEERDQSESPRRELGGEAKAKQPKVGEQAAASSVKRTLPAHLAKKSGGGGSRGKGSQGKGGMDDMAIANARLALQMAVDLREIKGGWEYTVLAPSEALCVAEGLDEGKLFAQEAKERKGQDLGTSAHVRIGVRFLAALGKMEEFSKDEVFARALQTFWESKVKNLSAEELKDEIQVFRVTKPKTASKQSTEALGSYARVCFRLKPATIRCAVSATLQEEILRIMKKEQWHLKYGAAPRSQNERNLRSMLQ